MNPGKWIIVAFVLFAGFIATLVVVCMRQEINLVSADYYKQELVYQDQIERINNAKHLIQKPVIVATRNTMKVTFDSTQRIQQGELQLFCPSNARMDRTFTLTPDQHEFDASVSGLASGMYRVKLFWTMNGKDYFQEEIVNL
jgi:hypothetical protein